jgi:hypothetical protein
LPVFCFKREKSRALIVLASGIGGFIWAVAFFLYYTIYNDAVDEIEKQEKVEEEIEEDIAAGILPSNFTLTNSTSIVTNSDNSTKILNPLIPGGSTGFSTKNEINSSAIAFLAMV